MRRAGTTDESRGVALAPAECYGHVMFSTYFPWHIYTLSHRVSRGCPPPRHKTSIRYSRRWPPRPTYEYIVWRVSCDMAITTTTRALGRPHVRGPLALLKSDSRPKPSRGTSKTKSFFFVRVDCLRPRKHVRPAGEWLGENTRYDHVRLCSLTLILKYKTTFNISYGINAIFTSVFFFFYT